MTKPMCAARAISPIAEAEKDGKAASMIQYCSVCKDYYDMEVVEDGGEGEVTWLRCPECHGILPYMELPEEPKAPPDASKFGPDSFSKDEVVEYDSHGVFEVGKVIYHRSWNDYGKVIEKILLPGKRFAIRVQFLQQGAVQLLENVHDEA